MKTCFSLLACLFAGMASSPVAVESTLSYAGSPRAILLAIRIGDNAYTGADFGSRQTFAPVHSWYPRECCMDVDCAPLDAESIRQLDSGWYIVDTEETIGFLDPRVRRSLDGQYHRCAEVFWEPKSKTRCLFTPEMATM